MDQKPFGALPGVEDLKADGPRLSFTLYDDPDEMVKLAAGHRLVRMEYERPSLEEIFLTYYGGRTGASDERLVCEAAGEGAARGQAGRRGGRSSRWSPHGQDAVEGCDHLGGGARALQRGDRRLVHTTSGERGADEPAYGGLPEGDAGGVRHHGPRATRNYMNSQVFVLAPLALAFFPILALAGAIAGAEERGTIDVLLGNPIPRWQLVVGSFVAMALSLLAICAVVGFLTWGTAVLMDVDLSLGRRRMPS